MKKPLAITSTQLIVTILTVTLLGLASTATAAPKANQTKAQATIGITSRPCPFTCASAKIPKSKCREWKKGSTCFVEDTSKSTPKQNQKSKATPKVKVKAEPPYQPLPVRAPQKGFIAERRCPFSCRNTGLPADLCRDWRKGELCYIEDLTRDEGFSPVPLRPEDMNRPEVAATPTPAEEAARCRSLRSGQISAPHITINRMYNTGNLFGSAVKVQLRIEGQCIQGAYMVKDDKVIGKFQIPLRYEFRIYDQTIRFNKNDQVAIEVEDTTGGSNSVRLDKEWDKR